MPAAEAHAFLRSPDWAPWVVAFLNPPDEHSNAAIVAARKSRAQASAVVERNNMPHREYRRCDNIHLAYSRLLCAQVVWHRPMHGHEATQFVNVHTHHCVAKKDPTLVFHV